MYPLASAPMAEITAMHHARLLRACFFYCCFPQNIFLSSFLAWPLVSPQIPKFRGPQALGPVPTAVGVSIAIDKIFAAVLNMGEPVSPDACSTLWGVPVPRCYSPLEHSLPSHPHMQVRSSSRSHQLTQFPLYTPTHLGTVQNHRLRAVSPSCPSTSNAS